MKFSFAAFLTAIVAAACHTTPRDDSDAIARALVGEWQYDYGGEVCPGNAIVGYRANGTVTTTFGDCRLDSDGFGRYVYGWYVVDETLCVFELEEEFDDIAKGVSRPKLYRQLYQAKVREGFV
jgi:hypothetical protein